MRGNGGNLCKYISCMLIRLIGRLDIRGGARQKRSFSAFCEADVFVIELTKNVVAQTHILNPS